MKKCLLVFTICFYVTFCQAQKTHEDSVELALLYMPRPDTMEHLLTTKKDDTSKANFLGLLSFAFAFNEAEKSVMYGQRGVQLSRQIGYKKGVAYCTRSLAWGLWGVGNYSNALQTALNALHIYEEIKDEENIAYTYYTLANIYRDFGDYKKALAVVQKGFKIYETRSIPDLIGNAIIGSIYDLQNRLDSASFYVRKAVELDRKINEGKWGWLYYLQGNIQRKLKKYDSAMFYYRTALPLVDNKDIVETFNGIAILYKETGKLDSSIFYATEVLQKWSYISYQRGILQAANILAGDYKMVNQRDSTIKYLELSVMLNNKLFNQEKERDIQNIAFNEQIREDEIRNERQQYYNQLKMYALITAGLVFLIIALLLWRNNQHKKKANLLLLQQKEKVESTLSELKVTQTQLIQSEKMASLGELTAGITHEIQNPLNFVNNFSDVNSELIEELNQEAERGNFKEVKEIAKNIRDNEKKIIHHGKRADAIVKGMLQHSRLSSGQKESTDINALADEYLRLSYHGIRAKDKDFNATIKTDFDKSIGKINIVPQDIGRVLLNLYNNAFYALAEKKRLQGESYEPAITVTTKKLSDKVEIQVKDNGNGVSQNIVDKIFQPFFTTKPTGQGTGLGLSLSYDIIKAHGGEIKVESKEREGSEFVIQLPIGQ